MLARLAGVLLTGAGILSGLPARAQVTALIPAGAVWKYSVSFDLELLGHPGVPQVGQVVAWGSGSWGVTNVPTDLGPVVAVSAGMYHSMALKREGTVAAWGGDGTDYQEVNDVPPGLSDAVAISAGGSISLALKVDGTVVAWGYNGPDGATNVPAGLSDVIAISAGGYHSLALQRNGRVVGWGQGTYGQTSPPADLTNAVAIAAGGHHSLALRANGTVVGFGYDGSGEASPPSGLSDGVAIAAGQDFSLVLRANGTVVAWGRNSAGQTNVPPGLSDVIAISAGGDHSLALTRDGAVVAWGRGGTGETNVPSGLNNVLAVDAGSSHCLALAHASPPLTLAEAVDAADRVWTTGGALPWFPQTDTSHDGVDAAQGTVNIMDERSWISTTVNGPARVNFHWKCSTLWPTYDRLAFYVDEESIDSIPGDADWQAASFLIPPGTHNLKWTFEVDSEPTAGFYHAWLDRVTVDSVLLTPGCAGSLDPAFDASPGVWPDLAPQAITSVKVQPDGSVIIAGAFEQVQGIEVGSPARLLTTGRLDTDYVSNPADVVSHKQVVQPDGKTVAIVESEENPFRAVVRHLAGGAPDPSFTSALPEDFDARALALQPDGKILVAGGIYPIDPETHYDTIPQPVLRLNPDGSIDPSFATTNVVSLCPEESAGERLGVYDLIQQPDGRIYVGGFFTAFNGVRRTVVARLNVDGTLDPSFEPDIEVHTGHDQGIVETVTAMAFAPDGKLYVAGFLEHINGLTRRAIARLHTAPDSCPGIVEVVSQIAYVRENEATAAVSFRRFAQTNATAVVGYSTYKWSTHPNSNYHNAYAVAGQDYVEQTGTVSFAPGETVKTITVPLLDDALVESSECFFVNLDYVPEGAVFDDHAASTLVMIWDDEHVGRAGSVDETFLNSGWNAGVSSLALAPDGTVFVGGWFTQAGGLARQGLARCAPNGYVTPGFAPVLNGGVREVAVEPQSGRIVIAGTFTTVNGVPRPGLARLNPEGTLDASFNPSLDGEVWELELMANGQMFIAGPFTNVASQVRHGFARLNRDGSLDPSFNAGTGIGYWNTSHRVNDLLALPDGKVVVTGWFWDFNGTTRRTVVRLNQDGSIDTTFNPTIFQAADYGNRLLLQPDGKLLVSGWIRYGLGGVYHVGLVRLHPDGSLDTSFLARTRGDGPPIALQSDGKILFGGTLRLNADGTDDPTWFAGAGFGFGDVTALALLPNDKLIVGGGFPQVNGFPYAYLACLHGDATARLGEALDTVGLTWTTGSKPWFGQTAVSHDGVDAAQSATNLTCDDHGWLKTTVTGPGTVSFRWKAQIDGAESFMAFYVAGGSGVWPEAAQLEETTDWQSVTCSFGPGEHDLFWVTYGNCANYSQQIVGWLDDVVIVTRPEIDVTNCVAAPPGLVAWWRAEGNAADAVGGQSGQLINNASFDSGRVGQAFAFDGSSYVEVPDAPALRLERELTIEFWVRRERLDQVHYIIEKGGDWTWGQQNYAVALHTGAYNHCLHFLFAGGWRGGGRIADTNWHHCAVVARDGDADPVLYIDGAPQPIVYGEGAPTIRLNPSTRPLHLGAQIDPQSGWFYYYQGGIDELSLYNRALSAQVIEDLYRAGSHGKCATSAPPSFVRREILRPTVQLVATPPTNASVYAVEDQVQPPAVIAHISHGGVFDAVTGKVKFGPFYDSQPRTLSYSVLIPPGCIHGVCGRFTFTGTASADGVNTPIAGDAVMLVAGLHPADLAPADSLLSIGEVTGYGAAWRRGEAWPLPPVPIPMDYATRAAFLWRGGECYQVDPAATNAPLCWVNCGAPRGADFPSAVSPVSNLPAAQRQMANAFVPGEPLLITVSVTPASARAYAVEEQFPAGWTVATVSDGGEFDAVNGTLRWGPFLDNTPRTLRYRVTPPATASGTVQLTGAASFDGMSLAIAGACQVQEGCRVSLVRPTPPGRFELTLNGRPGVHFIIEASSDLATWTALGEVTTGTAPVTFVDPGAAQFPQRFYRAREAR